MNSHLATILFVFINTMALSQLEHRISLDFNSQGQFNDFNPSDKDVHVLTHSSVSYGLKQNKFNLEVGFGAINRYVRWDNGFGRWESTSNGICANLNLEYQFVEWNKLYFSSVLLMRNFWEFYSYKYVLNTSEFYQWKKNLEPQAPMLQFILGPKFNYEPFNGFNLYGIAGISFENFEQFASSFSTDFELHGLFQFGLNYQFDLSKKISSE